MIIWHTNFSTNHTNNLTKFLEFPFFAHIFSHTYLVLYQIQIFGRQILRTPQQNRHTAATTPIPHQKMSTIVSHEEVNWGLLGFVVDKVEERTRGWGFLSVHLFSADWVLVGFVVDKVEERTRGRGGRGRRDGGPYPFTYSTQKANCNPRHQDIGHKDFWSCRKIFCRLAYRRSGRD